jgi:alanine dehydrogenase
MALLITESEVAELLTMRDCIDALEGAFMRQAEGLVENLPRRRLHPPDGLLHCMEACDLGLGRMGLKVYTSFRPKARFMVLLYDSGNGDLLATIEADKLGQMRTGAATGVATKYMARKNASVLGLFGAGWQAETQALAVAEVRELSRILVYSRTPEKRQEFTGRLERMLAAEVIAADDPELVLAEADIVVTATTSKIPVFDGSLLRPGAHVNAVGSNSLAKAEVDVTTASRADRVVVDSIEQSKIESGDLLAPIELRKIRWEQVRELHEVVSGLYPGREADDEITLFKSNGLALEDIAAASLVYERARGREIGLWER